MKFLEERRILHICMFINYVSMLHGLRYGCWCGCVYEILQRPLGHGKSIHIFNMFFVSLVTLCLQSTIIWESYTGQYSGLVLLNMHVG